ncbi:FAD-binding oxidoreductase [Rhizobium sp. RU36D]|uniref:NAD(P)/FAD-dependent oxidoreductase n=1 Tax=Rhizobium sp. RU36D TaxID=1907415 RepID=UPI0009D7CA6D|nr:FAD-binding oxidoreductase [Rhizobium sp. RU36D]SMD11860.1 Glycine/D-amino acid oxidase [Rhizobium sp. RU36D]
MAGKIAKADVTIVGGGIVGLCLAGFLAEEGRDVVLVDNGQIGGSNANAGSLHVQMQSRFMRLYPENVPGMERQLHLYPKAVRFWQEFERKLGADFELKKKGGLMVAENADQLDFLRRKAERERQLGLEVEILEEPELRRLAPYLGPAAFGAELCLDEGKLNPLRCNAAIRKWILGLGVRIIDGENVEDASRDQQRFVVATDKGSRIESGALVLAAAVGTQKIAQRFGVNVPTRAEPLHMNITEPTTPMIEHLVQHADRMITLKQFSTGQIVIGGGWPADLAGDREHPTVRLDSMIANATLACHIAPVIGPLRIIRTWAGINTSVDGKGVLGPIPSVPGLFFAVPGDAGYTLGPLSARMVADMVVDRNPGEDMEDYRPERFAA